MPLPTAEVIREGKSSRKSKKMDFHIVVGDHLLELPARNPKDATKIALALWEVIKPKMPEMSLEGHGEDCAPDNKLRRQRQSAFEFIEEPIEYVTEETPPAPKRRRRRRPGSPVIPMTEE